MLYTRLGPIAAALAAVTLLSMHVKAEEPIQTCEGRVTGFVGTGELIEKGVRMLQLKDCGFFVTERNSANGRRILRTCPMGSSCHIEARLEGGDGVPLRAIAGWADEDSWRQQLRDPRVAKDRKLLERLAEADLRFDVVNALAQTPDIRALSAYLEGLGGKNVAQRAACLKAVTALKNEALPAIEARLAAKPALAADVMAQAIVSSVLHAKGTPRTPSVSELGQ